MMTIMIRLVDKFGEELRYVGEWLRYVWQNEKENQH